MRKTTTMLGLGFAGACLALTLASATPAEANAGAMFTVTVTNLTRGQILSPLLVASHEAGVSMFTPGAAASPELATLAEDGDNMPLATLLGLNMMVEDVQSGAGPILPGASDTVTIRVTGHAKYLSLASMLVNTNDAFVGLDMFPISRDLNTSVYAIAYDAGSEFNSESCMYIPGPACGAGPVHDPAAAEGFVYVSNGVQGIGDLDRAVYDYNNPVAKITISAVVSMP